MPTSFGSFPHPVIGNGDDVHSQLLVEDQIVVTPTPEDVEIRFNIFTDDEQVEDLVTKGEAKFVFWWHCSSTFSSGMLEPFATRKTLHGWTFECSLDQREIEGPVAIDVELVAIQEIAHFSWTRQNADYQNAKFTLRPGDYLGLAGGFTFEARKLYDPLNPPLGSFFEIVEEAKQRTPIDLGFNKSEAVTVWVSSETATELRALGPLNETKIALVMLPALMETFTRITLENSVEGGESFDDKEWYQALMKRAEDLNVDISKPLQAAQRFLANPTIGSLEEINSQIEEE